MPRHFFDADGFISQTIQHIIDNAIAMHILYQCYSMLNALSSLGKIQHTIRGACYDKRLDLRRPSISNFG